MKKADYIKKLKTDILSQIQDEKISRLDVLRALVKRYLPWVLASVVIVIGGIAFSVTIFVVANQDWRYRSLAPLVKEAFEWLPIMWMGVLVGGGGLWLWLTQQTEFGYRKRMRVWLMYGGMLIVVLGALFYRLGIGVVLDRYLSVRIPSHRGIEMRMINVWLDPVNGRLIGVVDSVGTSTMSVVDINNKKWLIDTQTLPPGPGQPNPGEEVRILGYYDAAGTLHACRLFFVVRKNIQRPSIATIQEPGNSKPGANKECRTILSTFENERMFAPARSK